MSDYSQVPERLKKLPQWVTFKLIPNEKKGKPDKVPYNPRTGYMAKSNDPSTWADYNTAVQALQQGGYDGIGFEFGSGVFGVDLDNVVQDGQLTPEALDIIGILDSYTEYSPSGTGIHILCMGTLPPGRRRRGRYEMYSEGRFFTVTGKVYGEPKDLQERTAEAAAVHAKYLQQGEQLAAGGSVPSDTELLDRMFNSASGERIKALWGGDWSGYSSQSDADLALCNHLAYWVNGDAYRMDVLFRASGLYRPKWDAKRGAKTYGQITIGKVLEDFTPYAGPRADFGESQDSEAPGDPPEGAAVLAPDNWPSGDNPQPDAVSKYLEETLAKEIQDFKAYKDRKTGFSNLDAHTTGLYPGLYVLGATSSLGKTTFIHQLGDQLAAAGDHVLFFSLEQNRLEMVTKSISRIMGRKDRETAVSAIQIRGGKVTQGVLAAAEEYAKMAGNVSIIECNFNTNVNFIIEYTRAYINANQGIKPVVIVDYLQIIPATDPRQTERDRVDSIVRGLKKMQGDHGLVVFVISSFNRQNYLTPVDFESFKESGGIEYTADVVWGLQLQILNEPLFDKDKQIKEKREKVKEAKRADPREIELVCLKNRYGWANYSCNFKYYPRCDLFVEEYNDFDRKDKKPGQGERI